MNLESFLTENDAVMVNPLDERLSISALFPSTPKTLGLSGFNAPMDTGLYALLIEEALGLVDPEGISTLLDLGAGSSIPTLSALSRNLGNPKCCVTAIDIDPAALRLGMDNAQSLGLGDRYSFVQADMLDPSITANVRQDTIVCSNPPYLPVPSWADQRKFFTVNGGEDGTTIIEHILSSPQSCGTVFAIQWSSLSNPMKVLNLIEASFQVIYAHHAVARFGAYTSSPELSPYLHGQRELGLAAFSVDEAGNHSYRVIGTVLVRK